MGEEKKDKTDSLQSVMDAVADVVSDYKDVAEEYAYQKGQLDTLKRYALKNEYVSKERVMELMGWDEDGEH